MKKIVSTMILTALMLSVNLQANSQEVNSQGAGTPFKYSLYANKNLNAREYILGPNDVIDISVFDKPEYKQEKIRVQPNGKITIFPLGSINISGLTVDELRELLIVKYKFYLKDPQVSINLIECKPSIIYITGAVLNPGSYEINTNTDESQFINSTKPEIRIERTSPLLSNILVAAGGITYDADIEHIRVVNNITNDKFEINLLDLLENGNNNQDIYLIAGDSVYIPKFPTPFAVSDEKYKKYAPATFSQRSVPVKVFGYVNNPGLVKLDASQSLNINSAITSAGGYLRDSAYAPKQVYLSRVDTSGKLVTRVVNPMSNDIAVMPNDIIYIPEKARPLAGKTFDYIVRIINPVNTFAQSYNNWALMFDPTRNGIRY